MTERFRRATEPMSGCKLFSRSEIASHLDQDAALDRGIFLARLWALFGAAEPCDDGFRYELHDEKTGLTFTAYSGASGPSYGGPLRGGEALRPVLEALERLLARTEPVDCELAYAADDEYGGGTRILGFREGRSFDRDAVARTDPKTARTPDECIAIAAEHAGRDPFSGWQSCLASVIDHHESEPTANDEAGSGDDKCLGFSLDADGAPIVRLWLDAFERWKTENARGS